MRFVFAFVAGAAIAGIVMSWALAPAPCRCPSVECVGPVEIAPAPPHMGTPSEGILL